MSRQYLSARRSGGGGGWYRSDYFDDDLKISFSTTYSLQISDKLGPLNVPPVTQLDIKSKMKVLECATEEETEKLILRSSSK